MSTAAADLRGLHELHIRLRDVNDQLDRGPKQIKARQQFTARKLEELETGKETLLELKKSGDAKSLQLRSTETHLAEFKVKLGAASSNKEYDILKGQIEADTMANSVLEDEILEVYERIDQAETTLKALEENYLSAQEAATRVCNDVETADPDLRREVDELGASITEAEKMLPSSIAVDYKRLVKTHGASALAAVVNAACSECNFGLSPQSRVQVNSGKLIFCTNCGRLLYPLDDDD
jgi:uncharacterized protein